MSKLTLEQYLKCTGAYRRWNLNECFTKSISSQVGLFYLGIKYNMNESGAGMFVTVRSYISFINTCLTHFATSNAREFLRKLSAPIIHLAITQELRMIEQNI